MASAAMELLLIKHKCIVCGKMFRHSENIGSLECSLKITFPGERPIFVRTCHIVQDSKTSDAGISWIFCINKLGDYSKIPKSGLIGLSKPIASEAIAEPKIHNQFLRTILNTETQMGLYEKMKIPEDTSIEFTDVIYVYQYDWRNLLPIVIKLWHNDVIQSMQPFKRSSYFYNDDENNMTKHVFDTCWYKKQTKSEQDRIIRMMR